MTIQPRIPDTETRKWEIEQLHEYGKQLDRFTLALDELLATVEADLRQQKRERLQRQYIDRLTIASSSLSGKACNRAIVPPQPVVGCSIELPQHILSELRGRRHTSLFKEPSYLSQSFFSGNWLHNSVSNLISSSLSFNCPG